MLFANIYLFVMMSSITFTLIRFLRLAFHDLYLWVWDRKEGYLLEKIECAKPDEVPRTVLWLVGSIIWPVAVPFIIRKIVRTFNKEYIAEQTVNNILDNNVEV